MIQREVTIGRAPDSDILIGADCPYVSNNHALIYSDGYRLMLKDTSTNGTYINNNYIHHQTVLINYGDSILLAGKYPLGWEQISIFFPMNSKSPMTIVNSERKTTKFEPDKIIVLPEDCNKNKIKKKKGTTFLRIIQWIGVSLSVFFGILFVERVTDGGGISNDEEYVMYAFWFSLVLTVVSFICKKKLVDLLNKHI